MFEFQQLGTGDVLARMSVSETPVTDVDSILSLTLLDPSDKKYVVRADPLSLMLLDLSDPRDPSPSISQEELGLIGGSNLLVRYSEGEDRLPKWDPRHAGLNSRLNSHFYSFESEPGADTIFTVSLLSQIVAEGDWVRVVPEPSTHLQSAAALSIVVFGMRSRYPARAN